MMLAAMFMAVFAAILREAGTPIGPNDLLIAATAVANDLTAGDRKQ